MKIKYIKELAVSSSLLIANQSIAQENILLIIADDYGADSSGLYSAASTAPTPNINALSNDGVRFTQAWSQPSCAPTRASILTGRFGFRTGVGVPGDTIPLNEFTIPQALQTAGYNTACIGKWHLSGNTNGGVDNPNLMGFDHYEGPVTGGINNYFNWTKVTNGVSATETNYATSENVDNALSWINTQGDDPWFCQVAFNAPHTPYHLPPNDLHSFDSLSGTNADINNNPLPYYHAMIEAMDTEIGRLLSTMDADTLANTNIIFIGDNGTPRAVSPGVVRSWKGTLYEGGVHVPFIVSGPAVNSPGRTVDATIHTVDLFETVLDLANTSSEDVAPANTVIDSVSVKAYLTDSNQDNYHSFAFADTFRTPVNRNDGITISDGTYKLIRFYSDGNEELYFLTNDPEETTNLNDGNMTNAELTAFNYLNSTLDALISGETIDRGENEPTTPIVNEDRTVILRKANATNFAIDGGRGGANGQNVYLWGYGPSNVNIRFVEVDRGDGYYSYVKQDTAHALDGGRGGARAQNVYLWQTSTNNFNQHWRKVSKGGDTYQLQKRNSLGFSIDGGRAGANTQNVYLWSTGNNNLNQHWIVEYQ